MLSFEEEVDTLATPGLLTERQAEAFVLRRIEAVPRPAAAESMGISVSGLDNAVRDAEKNITKAQETAEALETIRYQIPDDE